jgi:hypothetical protein
VISLGEYPLSCAQSFEVSGGHDLVDDTPYHFAGAANNAAYSALPVVTIPRETQLSALSFGYNGLEPMLGVRATLSHLSNVHVRTICEDKLTL